MTDDRNGTVVTFYSFKGGTGRTMALANVAWILAENGKRVLVADWDLESPGLHRFFSPFLPFLDSSVLQQAGGIIDMIRSFEAETTEERIRPEGWEAEFARVQRSAFSLEYAFANGGSIDFLSAGRQNQDYKAGVSGLDWDVFYDRLGGAALFDALRTDMKRNYDYALIDSRTGLSDVADICTIHLPDVLVDCFTLSEQGIAGAVTAARRVTGTYATREIRVLPVAMRIDLAEKDKADAGRTHAMRQFANLPARMDDVERQQYWSDVEVPYHAYYAYEETLATFGDRPGAKGSLLSAYEKLTSAVTDRAVTALPLMDEGVRIRWRSRFERKQTLQHEQIMLRYAPRDQAWAEWIQRVLTLAGILVVDSWATDGEPTLTGASRPIQALAIVSSAYADTRPGGFPPSGTPGTDAPLAVYVDDVQPLPEFRADSSVFIGGLKADEAAARVMQLVGREVPTNNDDAGARGARYPGTSTDLVHAPVANSQFIGREDDLRRLRSLLRSNTGGATSLVVLQGLGGVGKSEMALEYVHRFRTAYDLVWWIDADPSPFIDTALTDLGERMGLPKQPNVLSSSRAVLDALSRGEKFPRWLIVFNNAEEYDEIKDFLPQNPRGHVLVTSRNQAWGSSGKSVEVDVFRRDESIAHLRQRVSGITDRLADRVAEALGDLPIALDVRGALLAASGTTLTVEQMAEDDTSLDIWDLSLRRLKDESPAAHRLLEVCSVLARDIALDLLNSTGMAQLLRQSDPSVPSRSGAAKPIQQINKLSLLKLDTRAQQIRVHPILQNVVRSRMAPDDLEDTRRQVMSALAAAQPEAEVDNAESWDRYRILWPHLEVSEAAMRSALDSDDPAVLELLVDRLRYVWLRGTLDQGRELAARIEQAWTARIASATDPDERDRVRAPLLRLRFNLGNILREQGNFEQAYAINTATLDEQRQLLGEAHEDTLMTSGGLAADLRTLGRYDDALERDKVTYAVWSQEFGDDYPRTLRALNNLATSLRLTGRYSEAREHDELCFERRQVVLGPKSVWTLGSAGNLARDLRELGDYARSISLLRDVLAGYVAVRGPDALVTLNTQANLAVSLRSAGRADEAAPLLDAAYEFLCNVFGTDSPGTLACRLSRATNLLAIGDAAEADREAQATKEAYARLLGREHPHTLVCESNLVATARVLGDRQRALAAAESASRGLTDALRPEHPFLLAALMNLAVCRAENDDAGRATELAERLRDLMRKVLGAGHPDTLRCVANLALIHSRLGDRGATAAEPPVGLGELATALGASHPDVQELRARRLLHRVLDPHPY